MKAKTNPKFVVLTTSDISIGEFKTKRDLNNWLAVYNDKFRPVVKILSGKEIEKSIYLPIF